MMYNFFYLHFLYFDLISKSHFTTGYFGVKQDFSLNISITYFKHLQSNGEYTRDSAHVCGVAHTYTVYAFATVHTRVLPRIRVH